MDDEREEMSKEELSALVKQVSQFHPVGIIVNILFMGVVGAGLIGFFFKNKAFYGVAIFIAIGFAIRFLVMAVLNAYLRIKYSK